MEGRDWLFLVTYGTTYGTISVVTLSTHILRLTVRNTTYFISVFDKLLSLSSLRKTEENYVGFLIVSPDYYTHNTLHTNFPLTPFV